MENLPVIFDYIMNSDPLKICYDIKDVGVTYDKLSFVKHSKNIVASAAFSQT